jgi:L-lactate dehydrogenase complex protein LldE
MFYGEVGISTVQVLEHLGCKVLFDREQTCCGQPPYNAGDWASARQVAGFTMRSLLESEDPVVTPSASCAAMVREGYPVLYEGLMHPQIFELGEFLVHNLNIKKWPVTTSKPPADRRVAFHRACHGRGIGLTNEQEMLVGSLPWVHLVRFKQGEQCCGFGGAFSVTHNTISAGIGMEKLHNMIEAGAEEIVAGDMGCLMHLGGLIKKNKLPLKTRHFAELLAEAIAP